MKALTCGGDVAGARPSEGGPASRLAATSVPVDGDEPRRQVGRFSGLLRQVEGIALGQGPEQHLPPQTGRIDAVQGHQAVGQAVVVDLEA